MYTLLLFNCIKIHNALLKKTQKNINKSLETELEKQSVKSTQTIYGSDWISIVLKIVWKSHFACQFAIREEK